MTQTCAHLGENGICNGTYKGFGCIGERCVTVREAANPKPRVCEHLHESTYCSKYHRFFCPGTATCEANGSAVPPASEKA